MTRIHCSQFCVLWRWCLGMDVCATLPLVEQRWLLHTVNVYRAGKLRCYMYLWDMLDRPGRLSERLRMLQHYSSLCRIHEASARLSSFRVHAPSLSVHRGPVASRPCSGRRSLSHAARGSASTAAAMMASTKLPPGILSYAKLRCPSARGPSLARLVHFLRLSSTLVSRHRLSKALVGSH